MTSSTHDLTEPASAALPLPQSAPARRTTWTEIKTFLRMDAIEDWSTPNRQLQQATLMTVVLVVLYALSNMIAEPTHYFAFSVLGLACMDVMATTLASFSLRAHSYQSSGRLEAILMAHIPLWRVLALASLGDVLRSLSRGLIYLTAIALLNGEALANAQWVAASSVFALGLLVLLSIGLLSASVTILLRRGDPLAWLLGLSSLLLSGVLYPLEHLPEGLGALGGLLPLTPMLHGLRAALLDGQTLDALTPELLHLSLFFALLAPLSLVALLRATRSTLHHGASPLS